MSDQTIELAGKGQPLERPLRLSVVAGPHRGYFLVVSHPCILTLGRGVEASFRMPNENHLSRIHGRIEFESARTTFIDQRSTNGSQLNGAPVSTCSLQPGDRLVFGQSELLIEYEPVQAMTNLSGTDPTDLFSAASVANPPQSPTQSGHMSSVGDYQLIEELGKGGMAVVYKASHRPSGTIVAVKLVREEIHDKNRLKQFFAREATILAQLDHPGIVRARHLGVHEDRLYLVMDFVNTIDLLELLDSKPIAERVRVSCGVTMRMLEALHHAHQKGIVHRDVKPNNILSFREGRHLKVRLSDFGLAKFYMDAGLGGLTADQSIRGTVGYMAPEQFVNSKNVTPMADIYACGACLFRFLSGIHPSKLSQNIGVESHLPNGIPQELVQMLAKAVHNSPSHRFGSAAEFAQKLAKFTIRERAE